MNRLTRSAALFLVLAFAGAAAAAQPPATTPAPAPAEQPATPAPAEEKLVYVKLSVSFTDSSVNPPVPATGDIILELNQTKAPLSTANFLEYVDAGHYNGTIFHRIIPGFMIQGGGFTPDMQQKKTRDPIKNEWQNGLKNQRGTIAMARTSVADSATSQFFINVVDNAGLDAPRDGAAYAVFGKVVAGMDVVDKIKAVPTSNKGMHQNVPSSPVTITTATRTSAPGK